LNFKMRFKKLFCIILVVSILSCGAWLKPAFCETNKLVAYLCELGINFYKMGRYEDALTEFNKALMIDHKNKVAKKYTGIIFKETTPSGTVPAKATPAISKGTVPTKKETAPAPSLRDSPLGAVSQELRRGQSLSAGTVPVLRPAPKALPHKLTLQQLVAEAEKNIKIIDQKIQKEEANKEQAIDKQLLQLERQKKK